MPDWLTLDTRLLWWLGGLSAVSFVGTLILVPVLVVNMPADYFVSERRGSAAIAARHPLLRLPLVLAKNLVGFVLFVGGVIMLFTPGQGLLTIAMGIVLMDFPGKYALERRVATNGPITRSMNWIRRRWGKVPLELPDRAGPEAPPSD